MITQYYKRINHSGRGIVAALYITTSVSLCLIKRSKNVRSFLNLSVFSLSFVSSSCVKMLGFNLVFPKLRLLIYLPHKVDPSRTYPRGSLLFAL